MRNRDAAWFARHPGRTIYSRLATELEELGARLLLGIPTDDHAQTIIIIVRRGEGGKIERAAIIVPTLFGRSQLLPADEATCARIWNLAQ